MSLRECRCEDPVVLTGQNVHPHKCHRCSAYVKPEWFAPEPGEFFDRLEEARPGDVTAIRELRRQVEAREIQGREEFGIAYMTRDNISEGLEEAADLALYPWLEVLKARRDGEDEEEPLTYALEAAYHAAKAHEALLRMRSHYSTSISPS